MVLGANIHTPPKRHNVEFTFMPRSAYSPHAIVDDPALIVQVEMKLRYAAGDPPRRGQCDIDLRF